MTRTESETLFERFCSNSRISFLRVPEIPTKTPDYELDIEDQRIIVEVKEVTLNKEEKGSARILKKRGYGNVLTTTPGDRVRKKIADSSAQLKARSQGKYPCALVLFDGRPLSDYLSPYNIRVAMYGLEQIHIAVPRDPSISPYATGKSYGPKRKMTKDHNTSISAIGVLSVTPKTDVIDLNLYHNKFAAITLDPKLLGKHRISQFKLEDEVPGKTAQWEEIVVQNES